MDNTTPRFSPAFYHALSLVEAMPDHHLITVPREPTLAMAVAGARAGRTSQAAANAIYRAMIRTGQMR